MSQLNSPRPHFYFSLPRLIALFRGGDPGRAETNPVEARVVGGAIYLISFLFFAQFVPAGFKAWQSALSLMALVLFVSLFWLVVLFLNSLLIKLLRLGGIFQGIPIRRAQSILLGISATTMAWSLLQHASWMGEIAAIWLTAVALNLAAAIILAFHKGAREREK